MALATIFGFMSLYGAVVEGKDYIVLEKEIPDSKNTLIKVFSYDCPFCYKYDKSVTPAVVKKLPSGMVYEPYHLKTKGKYGALASEVFAVMLVEDKKAGVNDIFSDNSKFKKAKMAYYQAYHDKRERWGDGANPDAFLKTGLDAVGMSKADFEKLKESQDVKNLLSKWDASYDVAKVQGVPAFVVNGKYLILTKSIRSIDGMVETIKELSVK
ncbi:thiol:disulfide interchange protein DsbA/DsbL [Helicobacter sp. 16-1353]|uniref:thiol:disulfide interchange protein DsbA/DsbL n=1 Tax=Helicobacter sp. 16-1353 TaxID=2004996 RepID=UPI00215C977F|nr:thiol:disulfide interchange protein DsbA/DsbL [Helicobacter sp. 16-1353]